MPRPRRRRGPWHGPHGHRRHGRRHRTLRRRLTFAFAFVALAAVATTTWLTLGAVFEAQAELFASGRSGALDPAPDASPGDPRDGPLGWGPSPWRSDDATLPPAAAAFRRIARTSFLAGLLSFALAAVAAGLFTRVLTRPLLALTRGARRLAAGERGIRLPVPTARDELRDLTEAFNGLVAGLERQEAWRRDMTADIAHDLRTPLAVLRGEVEGMQDGVVARDEAALARLHGEVMRLARLVDDLRTLAVTESGGLPLRRDEVELEPLLRRALDALRGRAAAVGATLTLRPIAEGLTARVDPDRLDRVLGNLLDNALRYAGPTTIEAGAERAADGGVRITVRDGGPGLPAEALERVFERFYRGDPSRTRPTRTAAEGTGSGLGLAIARAIVEAHGGRLEARNDPEGGAVFTVRLPA